MQLIQKQNNLSTSLISVVEELITQVYGQVYGLAGVFVTNGILKKGLMSWKSMNPVCLFLVNRADKVKEVNEEQQGHRDFR